MKYKCSIGKCENTRHGDTVTVKQTNNQHEYLRLLRNYIHFLNPMISNSAS